MADLAEAAGSGADAWHTAADEMQDHVIEHAWDGQWYLRAFDAAGEAVGSRRCLQGQIYVEPQAICTMAGIGVGDGRAERALGSVGERLATPHGIALLQPAYSRYDPRLGEISSYPPGYKENGGIFCHTNPWVVIAEARLGHGDQAHDYYSRINPSRREDVSEVHRCEPYVYAQMIAGPEAPTFGEAKNSWLTGTASWSYVAVSQWILGIRPTYRGLRIAPVLPSAWTGYSARRFFRGCTYQIQVRREGPGSAVTLRVDGQPIEGDVVPLPPAGTNLVAVEATLG
jgi:cellobiose phosphorylase